MALVHRHRRKLRKRWSPVAPGVHDLGAVDAPHRRQSSHIHTMLAQGEVDFGAVALLIGLKAPALAVVAGGSPASLVVLMSSSRSRRQPGSSTTDGGPGASCSGAASSAQAGRSGFVPGRRSFEHSSPARLIGCPAEDGITDCGQGS